MSYQIWKYKIEPRSRLSIAMPEGARILNIQVQHADAAMWALVDTNARKVCRRLAVYGTGHDLDYPAADYLGTFQGLGGTLVWHVFDFGERDLDQ